MDDMTETNSPGPLLSKIIHAAIDWNPLIHHYIGPEPMEKQEKYCKLSREKKLAIRTERQKKLKKMVPSGPYPIRTTGSGWTLAYFEDTKTIPKFVPTGYSCVDVGFFDIATGRPADTINITVRQEIWDHKQQKLKLNQKQWTKTLTKLQAYKLIHGEIPNWEKYKDSYAQLCEKEKIAAQNLLNLGQKKGQTKKTRSARNRKKAGDDGAWKKAGVKRKIFSPTNTTTKKAKKATPKATPKAKASAKEKKTPKNTKASDKNKKVPKNVPKQVPKKVPVAENLPNASVPKRVPVPVPVTEGASNITTAAAEDDLADMKQLHDLEIALLMSSLDKTNRKMQTASNLLQNMQSDNFWKTLTTQEQFSSVIAALKNPKALRTIIGKLSSQVQDTQLQGIADQYRAEAVKFQQEKVAKCSREFFELPDKKCWRKMDPVHPL